MTTTKVKRSRLKATLRGQWWKAYVALIKHCYVCGGKLAIKYVAEEKKRRRVCSKCGTITYTNPKVVAGLIPVLPNGDVVLLQRDIEPARGKWSYPAGYMEMGESVADAAERETWEEIRTRVEKVKLLGIYSYPDAGVVTIVYVGNVKRGERPRPGDETKEISIFPVSQIPWKTLAFRSTTEALKDWLKNKHA